MVRDADFDTVIYTSIDCSLPVCILALLVHINFTCYI